MSARIFDFNDHASDWSETRPASMVLPFGTWTADDAIAQIERLQTEVTLYEAWPATVREIEAHIDMLIGDAMLLLGTPVAA